MNLALYRKYRPQSFEDLIGQEPIRITLLEALKQNRLVHAYLFSGPRGTGKTSTARLIAKAIQCERRLPDGNPCGVCELCVLSAKGELIDMIEIDAASNRGIDEIRDLREKIRFAPTRAQSKVYIIDEVHMLTKEAFNALLKSLEEPPTHVYFILATTEIHKIPATILSRCQRYDFKRISDQDIVARLEWIAQKENLEVERAALEMLSKYSEGGMRDAISLLGQFSGEPLTVKLVRERLSLSHPQACDELFSALGTGDPQKGLSVIESLHREGYDLQQFTTNFLALLRKKLHEAIDAKKQTTSKLLEWIDLFDVAWLKLKKTSIAQLPLEIAVIRATNAIMDDIPSEAPIVAIQQSKRQEGLLHLEAIKKQMEQILSAIENPSIRRSFQTGNLKDLQGKDLIFTFSSRFHYDTVHSPHGIVAIEAAFQKILNSETKVLCQLDEGPIAPETADVDTMGWETVEEPL